MKRLKYPLTNGTHTKTLDYLTKHLNEIDEDPFGIRWIMREGIWMPDDSVDYSPFPDLIVGYDEYAVPVELKLSYKHKDHAVKQLEEGKRWVEEHTNKYCQCGKFVMPNGKGFIYEEITI